MARVTVLPPGLCVMSDLKFPTFEGGGGREGGNGEIDGIGANSPDFNRPQMRFQFIDSF